MSSKYSGSDWLKYSLKIENMSPLGEAVGDLLGAIYRGIYHISSRALEKVDWTDTYHIAIILGPDLSTVDRNNLTELVVLCHDRMIRCSIEGVGPRYMRLRFHQRKVRTGCISERYPTIEQAIKDIREHHSGDGP